MVGKAVATAVGMVLVILRMRVIAEKRGELCQTIISLIGPLRTQEGCLRCDFCQGQEDVKELHLIEEWDTRGNLYRHLNSNLFRVLRGAMNLLQEPYELRIHDVPASKRTIPRSLLAVE